MMDSDAPEQASSLAIDAAQARLPRGAGEALLIPTRPGIEFGAYLRELCADAARTLGPENGVTVTCTAAEALLPTITAIRLGVIAEELIKDALEHAFPGGRGGRIGVTFTAEFEAWRLTVEDSGVGLRAADGGRLRLVRDLAGEIGGRLKVSGLVGGTRCSIVGPQPRARPGSTLRDTQPLPGADTTSGTYPSTRRRGDQRPDARPHTGAASSGPYRVSRLPSKIAW